MQNLSGLDAVFLEAETPSTPMNVVGTIVLDVRGRSDLGYETVVQRFVERLPKMAPFRRRLVETPFGLGQPVWIDLADLDVRDHVMRVRASARPNELEDLVARIAEAPLDRAKPLWEVWVIEGLADGRMAIVTKVHHAAVDGVSAAAMLLHLFDREFEPGVAIAPEPIEPDEIPSPAALLQRAAGRAGSRRAELRTAALRAGRGLGRILRARLEDAAPVRDAATPLSAPATSFNRAISSERSVAYARTPLDRIATIREAFGGTINDVVLAASTTALREYLLERDELPDAPLVTAIPISTRTLEDEPGGNRISAMLAELPVHIDEPVHRYWEVCRSARNAKRFHNLLGNETVAALAELSPARLVGSALRLYSRWGLASLHRPIHNVVISNVAGPPMELKLDLAPVESVHPHGPLMEGVGLNITVISYAGSLDIGVLACRESVQHVDSLARGIAAAIEGLYELAERELAPSAAEIVPLGAAG